MRPQRTSGTCERLTDLRRVGQAPPENLLTLDGQRYMTPAEAWALLRTDIRGFLELLRAGRLLDRAESRAEHSRVSTDALRRLSGRCALFMHWSNANPGVALAAWDRTTQRVIEAFAEAQNRGRTPSGMQDAIRGATAMFAEEREVWSKLSPTASADLASREARIADQAEALLRHTRDFAGVTPKTSEQIQALSRPFALWQTPETLAADHIARMVAGAGLGSAVTEAGRARILDSTPRSTHPMRPGPEQYAPERLAAHGRSAASGRMPMAYGRASVPERMPMARERCPVHARVPTRGRGEERLPAVNDPVDPVIRWTIEQGGVRPDELNTVDGYTFDRLLGFRGLVNQEGHLFAALAEHWMEEHPGEASYQDQPGSFFRELFFFMLAESSPDEALRTGVEQVDPVIIEVILRGGLHPTALRQLSDEEQAKVQKIPALISPRGLRWLEQARAHYQGVEVHERFAQGVPFDAVTADDFVELFRYALDYSVVDLAQESLPAWRRPRTRQPLVEPLPARADARSSCRCGRGSVGEERLPSGRSRTPRPDPVQAARNVISTSVFVLTWPGTEEQPFYVTGISLLEENDFSREDILELGALEPGQTLGFGGGAAQRVEVRRLREDETLPAVRRPGAHLPRRITERCPAPHHLPGWR